MPPPKPPLDVTHTFPGPKSALVVVVPPPKGLVLVAWRCHQGRTAARMTSTRVTMESTTVAIVVPPNREVTGRIGP